MADACVSAAIRTAGLELAVAITSDLCKNGQRAHGLAATAAIALGRLLTAAALVELSSKRRHGSTSLQVISQSRIKQVFADHNHLGHGRGFVRNTELAFPLMSGETEGGRRSVALAVLPGKMHVIRAHESGQYTHSTTELVTGELDTDVEHFLSQSDQIPTVLASDVLLGAGGNVELAGGVLVQALPGADLSPLITIKQALVGDGFANQLRAHREDVIALVRAVAPEAQIVEEPKPVAWKCRCSRNRVLDILRVMSPADLAQMVTAGEPVAVSCDLCSASYVIEPGEVEKIFAATIKAQG